MDKRWMEAAAATPVVYVSLRSRATHGVYIGHTTGIGLSPS